MVEIRGESDLLCLSYVISFFNPLFYSLFVIPLTLYLLLCESICLIFGQL